MEIKAFSNRLKVAGIEPAGINYWVECLENPQKAKREFETVAYLEHSFNWYNPKVLTFVRPMPVPEETRAYIFMAILAKLIPDPSEITTWPEMKTRILEIENITGFIHKTDLALPSNQSFLVKFEQRSLCSLEEWNLEQIHGKLWGLLVAAARLLRQAGPIFLEWCVPYMELLERLVTPSQKIDFRKPEDKGLLILSSHCRFHAEHTKQTKIQFRDQAFVVTGHMVKDEKTTRALPMLMLKALKMKNIAYVAVDGGKGNMSLEGSVFGCKIDLPSSFVWVASKADCTCQWAYLVANQNASGTRLRSEDISIPEKNAISYEEYCAEFVSILGENIENAMIDNPFSFGSYQQIGAKLPRT